MIARFQIKSSLTFTPKLRFVFLYIDMRSIIFPVVIGLAILFELASGWAQQAKGKGEKKRPAVTIEMIRELSRGIDERVKQARKQGNILTELDALRSLEKEYAAKGIAAHMTIAMRILTLAPELGNYLEALRCGDVGHDLQTVHPPSDATMVRAFKPVQAIAALLPTAETAQVVMINEAHHIPQHRAFSIELLKELRKKGFTYFATETLYEQDTGLQERGYPTKDTGFYSQEPVYGHLIRMALQLGYRVIAYEPKTFTTPDERERGQANNLIERVLQDNPKAKLIVHAGYSHIEESGSLVGAITMAQRFKEKSGINPLTIDQTEMTEHSERRYEQSLYRYATERGMVQSPTVFQNSKGKIWSLDEQRWDVTVFHPRSRYRNGRPDWLDLNGDRTSYRLPKDICESNTRCLVRAKFTSESKDAIPIDQIEVSGRHPTKILLLPQGEFEITSEDPHGKQLKSYVIKHNL